LIGRRMFAELHQRTLAELLLDLFLCYVEYLLFIAIHASLAPIRVPG
jgi:hypothetical protein